VSTEGLNLIRQEWDDGNRRLESQRFDAPRYHRLVLQVELVVDELRKKVGQTFTLAELADAYRDVEERAPAPGWPRDLELVLAAAFHAYQRGAVDFGRSPA